MKTRRRNLARIGALLLAVGALAFHAVQAGASWGNWTYVNGTSAPLVRCGSADHGAVYINLEAEPLEETVYFKDTNEGTIQVLNQRLEGSTYYDCTTASTTSQSGAAYTTYTTPCWNITNNGWFADPQRARCNYFVE